ncbi:MAG: cytochrome c-type biogenesis protein CcmH [Actinomycetota bacterium]|nr:cytochrome c-type biogenesis protein CcmH [Actinomycetota bacterium]
MSDGARKLAWLIVPVVALAVIVVGLWPGTEASADPEARAYHLAISLKCPICAGESLAGSQTDLAKDLRALIDEQIAAGRTDEEIVDMFVANYGEQVLLDPPSTGWGVVLWAVPLAVVTVGAVAVLGLRRKDKEPEEVSK